MTNEIYVSIDIEADGPIPGQNSMLSLGAAAFRLGDRTPISTFDYNLQPLPEATSDPDTMAWWDTQPEAWAAATLMACKPEHVMEQFVKWLRGLPGKPVLVGFPVTYDFMFVYWYTIKFTGFPAPFGFQGLDLKTMAALTLGIPFREATKRNMPKRWFEGCPKHTHQALDDAIGQGILFINLMTDHQSRNNPDTH